MNLDFLKNVKLEAVAKTAKTAKVPVVKLPTEADLRVFANGKVYPSTGFAAQHELQFVPKVQVGENAGEPVMEIVGNGLDIFSSLDWGMLSAARTAGALEEEFLCIVVVPKRDAKVDMWASTKYDEANEPKADVFTQGASTFSKGRLLEIITSTYSINWDEVEYVDFTMAEDSPIPSPTGVYTIPKVVSTGAKKGQPTYIRRENINVCPLVVAKIETIEAPQAKPADPFANVISTEPITTASEGETDTSADPGEDWASQLGAPEPASQQESADEINAAG